MAENTGNGADKATYAQAGNLAGQFPPAGLASGTQGTVDDIGWAPGTDTLRDPPCAIMMVKDKYTGPSHITADDGREVLPLLPFPLTASYVVTVHKSQGITGNNVVTDLSERDSHTGLSYVAMSEVKLLEGLMIDAPFDRTSLYSDKLPGGKISSM